jgi:hypothetical protein
LKAFISGKPYWWQWPTILSLDATLVAVLWQRLLAKAAAVAIGWPEAVVLGASVWLAYVADRWIEGWRLAPNQVKTQRHLFYQRWRWPVAALWALVFAVDLETAIVRLPTREFAAGLALLCPVLAYLLSHQLVHRHSRWRAPKEVCVAALLGAGVALFLVAQPSSSALASLAAPLALFTVLCFANCALISTWEHEVDLTHGQTSLALQFQQGAAVSRALPWLLAIAALFSMAAHQSAKAPEGCVFAGSVLLGLIDRAESRLGRQLARVLADVALMTPAIPLLRHLLS